MGCCLRKDAVAVKDKSHTPLEATEKRKLNIRRMLDFIASRRYDDDLQELVQVKERNWELEDEIRCALSEGNKHRPPISKKEAELDNPRRTMPPRNFLKEKASIVALEMKIVRNNFEKNSYKKDESILAELHKKQEDLNGELKRIK